MITVAVVSWNTRELLQRCLRSLAPDQDSGLADVWVVDNASSDGSAELVEREFPRVRLVRADENLGFGRAVNLVADRTTSEWLAVANADVELESGAFARLRAAGRDDRVGAVAPRLILPDGSTQHSVYRFPTLPFLLAFNAGAYRVSRRLSEAMLLEGRWDPSVERDVPWAIGAFLLLRREAFDAVGRFDTGQWMYAEDLDLGWRLAHAGWRTVYVPQARVRHASGAAARQAFGERARERWMSATYEWIARRRGGGRARAAACLNLVGALARRDRQWARIHRAALRRGA